MDSSYVIVCIASHLYSSIGILLLKEALLSIGPSQTRPPNEIMVSISRDDTLNIDDIPNHVRSTVEDKIPITVFLANKKSSQFQHLQHMMRYIQKTKSSLQNIILCMMDDDDISHPKRIKLSLQAYENNCNKLEIPVIACYYQYGDVHKPAETFTLCKDVQWDQNEISKERNEEFGTSMFNIHTLEDFFKNGYRECLNGRDHREYGYMDLYFRCWLKSKSYCYHYAAPFPLYFYRILNTNRCGRTCDFDTHLFIEDDRTFRKILN